MASVEDYIPRMSDDLVLEYLSHNGYVKAWKGLEADRKESKVKNLPVRSLSQLFLSDIKNGKYSDLKTTWEHFRLAYLVSNCDNEVEEAFRKMYSDSFKWLLVEAYSGNRKDIISSFFKENSIKLQSKAEWKDWFCLPFIDDAKSCPCFTPYFQKVWQDAFTVSLRNFLTHILSNHSKPAIHSLAESVNHFMDMKQEYETLLSERDAMKALLTKLASEYHIPESEIVITPQTSPTTDPTNDLLKTDVKAGGAHQAKSTKLRNFFRAWSVFQGVKKGTNLEAGNNSEFFIIPGDEFTIENDAS